MGIELVAMGVSLLGAVVSIWQATTSSRSRALAQAALQETRIELTVQAWKEKGQPNDYLDSIPGLGPNEKQTIRRAAEKRHKGR